MAMFIITSYLRTARNNLAKDRASLSDSILAVLRVCSGLLSSRQRTILNRELLGYLPDEVGDILAATGEGVGGIENLPLHRFLMGYWVPLAKAELPGWFSSGYVVEECIFYNYGMCELESILDKVSISEATWVSVIFDESNRRCFMCRTSELKNLYDRSRRNMCEIVDDIIKEIRAPKAVWGAI